VLAFLLTAAGMLVMRPFVASAQTIPELLKAANTSLGRSIKGSGPVPHLEVVMQTTDAIVRGTLGPRRSYLTDDQMNLYSDYEVLNAVFLYGEDPTQKITKAGVTLTVLGGQVEIDGLTFTMETSAVPALASGVEYVLLRTQQGDSPPAGTPASTPF
jgi:hypothetical protein